MVAVIMKPLAPFTPNSKEFDVPLLPFFMEEVYLKPQWMQDDGIHPNRDAQPFIADWMAKQLQPLVNHDS